MTPADLFQFLSSRSAELIPAEEIRERLMSGKQLRVKLGIDANRPNLHLGHLVPLHILRAFQDAGHQAVLIMGDFTATIGDPAEQETERPRLSLAETKQNAEAYRNQIGGVLHLDRVEMRHNSEWFTKVPLQEFLSVLSKFSLKSAWEREDFQTRLAAGREVRLHEAMYHVLQAYDSYRVQADIEIGAVDQKLNVLAGRELQASLGETPQAVVLLPYLIGLDGGRKMSKSFGNSIAVSDSAKDMVGKVMSIPDSLIIHYAELAAWMPTHEVATLRARLDGGENPRDVKRDVAMAVTRRFHGAIPSKAAIEEFHTVFSEGRAPSDMSRAPVSSGAYHPAELILLLGVAPSKAEARRLWKGSALEVDGETISGERSRVSISAGTVIRVGKRRFWQVP